MYSIVKFEAEQIILGDGTRRDGYVALVQKEGEEQPFRVVVENFDSAEAAMAEVKDWIAAREKEEADKADEQTRVEAKAKADKVLEELNSQL